MTSIALLWFSLVLFIRDMFGLNLALQASYGFSATFFCSFLNVPAYDHLFFSLYFTVWSHGFIQSWGWSVNFLFLLVINLILLFLWIIFVLASCDKEQWPLSFQVMMSSIVEEQIFCFCYEFACSFGIHDPKQERHFHCLWWVNLASIVKQEIARLIVEEINGICVFWRGFSVLPVLLKLQIFVGCINPSQQLSAGRCMERANYFIVRLESLQTFSKSKFYQSIRQRRMHACNVWILIRSEQSVTKLYQ